ncbi:unnamed protein product [Ceratitis capitata]|uniref:(Mediterranean fruit fly) hypothetical protein n=1 Tax=Ceratitis capitata TaxID=7213 RepID=A0A811UVL5_CERCA|nr:unnamed protein product [Ceratitis capitata]
MRGCIPNVDCGIRRSYPGPKQRLSVVQNVLRRPKRCDRRRAFRTPEHFNNRQKINCRGVVDHEFLPQGRTVNKEYYLQVMRNLGEAIRQKRPNLWENKNWLLHHDNAPAHTSLLVRDFLAKNNTIMMPQPPYSPDLASCDFF